MELILTPRLETVARLVPPGVRFADIGTDHAYLPAKLLLDGTIDRAIAAALADGWRTADIADASTPEDKTLSTAQMGEAVASLL